MGYIAKPMEAPPGGEILGVAVLDWVDNLAKEITTPIFKDFGLSTQDIDPKGWYSLDIVARLYRAVHEGQNGMESLTAMGKASAPGVIERTKFKNPDDFIKRSREPFLAALRNIPDEYGIEVRKLGARRYEMTNNSIVPNSMIYGYIWGVMAEFREQIDTFTVKPVRGFQDGGNVRATFEVKWS